MSKFWTARTKSIFRRQPLKCTLMVAGYVIWYGMFAILTLFIGGVLVIAGKNDEWVNWWLPW